MNVSYLKAITCMIAIFMSVAFTAEQARSSVTPEQARIIAKDAYLYCSPMADNYRIMYGSFVDQKNPEYKAPWNQIKNISRVYTPDDRKVQTPNSDTPYSWLGMDLRTEPLVLTVPTIEKERYFSIQLIDLYTHNFDYIGSRATGSNGGNFLIAGPAWTGSMPDNITKVIRSETELATALYRTQLFNPGDIENVKAIQAHFKVQPLSTFLGQPAPKAAPPITFIKPLSRDELKSSPEIFQQLNFLLQFCPTHPSEKAVIERFARIGIEAGKTFDMSTFSPEIQAAIKHGIADAWAVFADLMKQAESGKLTSAETFGTREHLNNNYEYRMIAAVLGIWGNTAEEADYPTYLVDADGQKLDGSHRYTLSFAADQLPPVNAFWSLTMYELPESLLVANPLNRYLLNSPMLQDFIRDADGGITLYLQNESPGKEKEPNWLPAPEGPFTTVLRLYWPKADALDGTWNAPPLKRMP